MRDALTIPLSNQESLVITTDNSGGIGMKEQDLVKVAYDTVGYFSFRVAMMECLASRAKPIAIVLHNFCGDEEWDELVSGVQKGLEEVGLKALPITGSTESNFPLVQSVVGLNIIGVKSNEDRRIDLKQVALIGLPLVGDEVIIHKEKVAPLSLFYTFSQMEDVVVWPVGSKGVQYELKRMNLSGWSEAIDLNKSGGPATSFLVGYPHKLEDEIKKKAGAYFHALGRE